MMEHKRKNKYSFKKRGPRRIYKSIKFSISSDDGVFFLFFFWWGGPPFSLCTDNYRSTPLAEREREAFPFFFFFITCYTRPFCLIFALPAAFEACSPITNSRKLRWVAAAHTSTTVWQQQHWTSFLSCLSLCCRCCCHRERRPTCSFHSVSSNCWCARPNALNVCCFSWKTNGPPLSSIERE